MDSNACDFRSPPPWPLEGSAAPVRPACAWVNALCALPLREERKSDMVVECKGMVRAASRYVCHRRAVRRMRNQAVALVARRRHNLQFHARGL